MSVDTVLNSGARQKQRERKTREIGLQFRRVEGRTGVRRQLQIDKRLAAAPYIYHSSSFKLFVPDQTRAAAAVATRETVACFPTGR